MSNDINNNLQTNEGEQLIDVNEQARLITVQGLSDIILAYKRVSKFTMSEMLEGWVNTINLINSLGRDVARIGDFSLDDYIIPTALSNLILPNSVTLTGVSGDEDILIRPVLTADEAAQCLSRNDFNNVSANIASTLFKDASKTSVVKRETVTFTSVHATGSYKGMVVRTATPFFPVPISRPLYQASFYNFDAKSMMHDAIVEKLRAAE